MRRYIEHLKNTKTTHERRQHAVRVSGIITATLFAVWLGTLGTRIASQEEVAEAPEISGETLSASAASAAAAATTQNSDSPLQVSTTSVFQ